MPSRMTTGKDENLTGRELRYELTRIPLGKRLEQETQNQKESRERDFRRNGNGRISPRGKVGQHVLESSLGLYKKNILGGVKQGKSAEENGLLAHH